MLRYTEKRTANGLKVRFFRLFDGLRLVKRRIHFQSNGLSMTTCILGLPIGTKWFDRSRIYGFGYAVNGHSNEKMMQFNYAGEGQIVLAKYVQESEVTAFLRHLQQEDSTTTLHGNGP